MLFYLEISKKITQQRDIYDIYMKREINANLPRNAIVRLFHPWSEDSQGQETVLATSADKQICNYAHRVLKSTSISIYLYLYLT